MTTLTQSIAKQIREYREKNNLTQRELAHAMGVQPATITRIENGESGITSTVLEKFCKISGQTINFSKAENQPSKVFAVCDYIISKLYALLGDESYELTNLKLQKLLYYVQMEYIGQTGQELFENKFVAWEHGPVYPDVYHKFKESGQFGIEPEDVIPPTNLSKNEERVIDTVLWELGNATAWELRDLTHEETPWKKRHQYKKNNPITVDDLKGFYSEYREMMSGRTEFNLDESIMQKPMSPP